MNRARKIVESLTAGRGMAAERGHGRASANIALVKYWGKRDEELNLPVTSSLSISLGRLGSDVEIGFADGMNDAVWLNSAPLSLQSPFVRRTSAYLDLFRPAPGVCFEVQARNTVPTAAGFASSASGFAALARALNDFYGWELGTRELSILARLGSGSAARSLEDGFVEWLAGDAEDGMDSYGRRLAAVWPELKVGALVLSAETKPIGSREAMKRTVESCELYREWPARVAADLADLKEAIEQKNMAALGAVAEGNALAMHGLMAATRPPVVYALPETVAAMRAVWQAREEGVGVWLTMDAGPNVKLLFEASSEAAVRERFPAVEVVAPFD